MTASLHALGCGASAGTYYTNDPYRESRNRDEYYLQDGGGRWWTHGAAPVRHGAAIARESFRDLCAGLDPASGAPLVRGAGEGHRAGWDMTLTAPKTVSLLWASGSPEQRAQDVLATCRAKLTVERRRRRGGEDVVLADRETPPFGQSAGRTAPQLAVQPDHGLGIH